jgi:hypothetical protein
MTNFLSYAQGPRLRAESKFVELNGYEQVDFCPFRGPDAPFAHERDITMAELFAGHRV